MKWAVNVCVDIPLKPGWGPAATNMSDTLAGIDGIEDCWFVSKKFIRDKCYLMEFHVAAQEMPIPCKVMEELRNYFNVSQINITRECWNKKDDLPFQWVNDGVTIYWDDSVYHHNSWDLLINNVAVFTVHYVPDYTKGWPRWRREKHFGNAQFAWEGMTGGCTPMEATTIDTALKEFEGLYVKMTQDQIDSTEKKLHEFKEELRAFETWKRSKH